MDRISAISFRANIEQKNTPLGKETESKSQESQTDLDVIKYYKRDLVKPAQIQAANDDDDDVKNPLDRFLLNPGMKFSDMHGMYYYHNRATYPTLMRLGKTNDIYWVQSPSKMETICPWKMHIFADTEDDWAKLVASVGRYLNTQKVNWKTLSVHVSTDMLNQDEMQKGKAFTVYTSSPEHFKKLAHDIDYIIRLNGLEAKDTNIKGDRKLGDTGRIFYRYEHKSGETKDKIFRFDSEEEWNTYYNNYDPNRGDDKYLAEDMTEQDDPFYNFNP